MQATTPTKNTQNGNGQNSSPVQLDELSPESQRLLDAKNVRKKVEDDVQLLANRIALLEIEEKKANKKIEETRKKAQEIMGLKSRNKEAQLKKQEIRQKEQEELMRKSQNLKEFKEASKQNAENNKNLMLSKIKNDVDTMKKIKKETKEQVGLIKDEESLKNTQVVTEVKNREKELELKKQKAREEKAAQIRREYEEKFQRELSMINDKKNELERLEKKEMELISKLQNTQNLQKQAFEELERALVADPEVALETMNNSVSKTPTKSGSAKKK